MRKNIPFMLILIGIVFCGFALAWGRNIIIHTRDGQKIIIPAEQVEKITFEDSIFKEISADFETFPDGDAVLTGLVIEDSRWVDKNPHYGRSMRFLRNGAFLECSFSLDSVPPAAVLSVTHLSSLGRGLPQDGVSPITITVNNRNVIENHSPPSKGYIEEQWPVAGFLREGRNRIRFFFDNSTTHYWLQRFSISDDSSFHVRDGGWRHLRYDMAGTAYPSAGARVKRNGPMARRFSVEGAGNNVLTGDVTGNGRLEIVTTSGSGDRLLVFNSDGTLKLERNLPRPSFVSFLQDVDGDGKLEIFLGGSGPDFAAFVYKGDGTHLKTFTGLHAGARGDVHMTPLALTNGKVLMGYWAGFARTPRGVAAFDYQSAEEDWYYQVGPLPGQYSVADMDGNGKFNITMRSGTVHNGASGNDTTDSDMYLVVVDEAGNRQVTQKYDSPSKGVASHVFFDHNGDGLFEILGFKGHDPRHYRGQSRIHLFSRDGSVLRTFDGPANSCWSYAVGDLTGDGRSEIVAAARTAEIIYILDSELNLVSQKSLPGEIQLLADLTGNGTREIVLLSERRELRVLNNTLDVIDTYSFESEIRRVIASDLDGNGYLSLIASGNDLHVIDF